MACKPCEVWRISRASTTERTAATMDFILDSCILPSSVNAGEPFTIQIKYKLCTIETRNPGNMMANFPVTYDGGWYWEWGVYPFRQHEFWLWRMVEMGLLFAETDPTNYRTGMAPGEIQIKKHPRTQISPGDVFTYTFTGTIEQLLGRQFPTPTTVNLYWSLYGSIYGWHGQEYWPWSWPMEDNFIDFSRVCWIKHPIQVNILPPFAYPVFKPDLCSVSKSTVAPNEEFRIKVTVENQNARSGKYYIGCYCEGNYTQLATGTITGYGTKSHTFNVTANQLAQRSILTSQFLPFTIVVSNDERETDRWTPPAIAVIVTEPVDKASLSGRVTDKQTRSGIVGVSVTTLGYSSSTNSSGYYSLDGLPSGPCSVKFSKSGYWEVIKTMTLGLGLNTLNVEMTPTTEPPPPEDKFPVVLIGLGVGLAAIVGGVLITSKLRTRGRK